MIRLLSRKIIVSLVVIIMCSSSIVISQKSVSKTNQTNSIQFDTKSNQHLDLFMQMLMQLSKVPSVSASIIKHDVVLWSKGYGFYDLQNNKPATNTTLYNIASISKTVTATALMQLYEQNLFELDEDINMYLPFSVRHPMFLDSPITFRMLLSHHSGFSEDPKEFYKYFPEEQCPIPLYPWIETYLSPDGNNYTSEIWSNDAPGERFHYANIGFALIGYLVERITGQPFYQYCKDNIFIPLKMYNTSYIFSDINLSNLAIPYKFIFNHYKPYDHYCYVGYPCGSIQTSVTDFSHFIIAHMNQGIYDGYQLLNATTIELMHTIQYPDGNYGLGWFVWNDTNHESYYGHTGGDYGVTTSVTVRVSESCAVVYFTNGSPWRPIQVIAWRLFENILFSTLP